MTRNFPHWAQQEESTNVLPITEVFVNDIGTNRRLFESECDAKPRAVSFKETPMVFRRKL